MSKETYTRYTEAKGVRLYAASAADSRSLEKRPNTVSKETYLGPLMWTRRIFWKPVPAGLRERERERDRDRDRERSWVWTHTMRVRMRVRMRVFRILHRNKSTEATAQPHVTEAREKRAFRLSI